MTSLDLDARQVGALATFLDQVTEVSRCTGVYLASYMDLRVTFGGNDSEIRIAWHEGERKYKLSDRVGSC